MSTIVLVTNDNEIKGIFKQNLVLLRNNDKLISVTYENAIEVVYEMKPDVVIIHEHDKYKNTLDLVNYIKSKDFYKQTAVILMLNKFNSTFILNAYDEGIDDFLLTNSDPTEILLRTINGIKKSDLLAKNEQLNNILKSYNIIDSKNGFYSSKFENEIIETVLKMNSKTTYTHMIVCPSEESKKNFSNENFITAIKKSIRFHDIVFLSDGSRYSLLLQTNAEGAIRIFEKIKTEISSDYEIKAGISSVENRNAEDIKKRSTCALNKSLLSGVDYTLYAKDEVANDIWLDESAEKTHTYKFLKNTFSKKIENIIAPIFYRLQKTYEAKLPDVKIEQFTDIEQSIFRISDGNKASQVTMRYPSYTKIIIYISHSGFDTPENREVVLTLSEFNQNKIEKIMEDFINEYVE